MPAVLAAKVVLVVHANLVVPPLFPAVREFLPGRAVLDVCLWLDGAAETSCLDFAGHLYAVYNAF